MNRYVSREEIEKNFFGKEKIIIDIPKKTEVLVITTVSRAKDFSQSVITETYGVSEIEKRLIKEDIGEC